MKNNIILIYLTQNNLLRNNYTYFGLIYIIDKTKENLKSSLL